MQSLAVFCGSELGRNSLYKQHAQELAKIMAQTKTKLIYGGAKVGLMGVLADTILTAGGEAVGVMPKHIQDFEVAHDNLTALHIVNSMHERKALMAKLADGFIILPGGIGTLDEFFEIFTWAKLGYHHKPIGILNSAGFYNGLLGFMQNMIADNFLAEKHRELIKIAETPDALYRALGFL